MTVLGQKNNKKKVLVYLYLKNKRLIQVHS